MPKVQYTYREDGDPVSFREQDILPPGVEIDSRAKKQVLSWNETAAKTEQPMRELVSVEILDIFLHEHVWATRISRASTGGPEWLVCRNCPVQATRYKDGPATLEARWRSESGFYEYCHEKKPVPKRPTFK